MYSFLNISDLIPLNSHFLWMNLGQPEKLFLPFLPGIGIPLLAIVVAISSYFQQKLITPPTANPDDKSAGMTKMMAIYMPLLMGYFAMTFASGLAIYFIASNLVGIGQYAMLGKLDWKNLIPGARKGEIIKK
jgi:YidC/Oxa1 family membrane protein insertase